MCNLVQIRAEYNAPRSLDIVTYVLVKINVVYTGGYSNCWKNNFVNNNACVLVYSLDSIVFVDTCYQLV